ncbi:phosphate/phosphite/phosphonate ABC transporter substrate-binding protein [Vibrio hannami]|uniref:phosphate/phosphite/phosphonate ABC transporter substrate-binding protein n=1 Tax=Vibrio hannami TaxID=2717094 RepID=UPI00241013DF|nr:phosphate/phosphite/phosphonate ABC transporter substrate-binding protein [Vibrio hannami]MDG3088045.1 phosphate/phosphite/phosphonate ABC transporter substrate-binding protein [Vibrio hannami]
MLSTSNAHAHDTHKEHKLVIGVVSNKAKTYLRQTYPLAIYLSEHLEKFGINSVEVRVNGSQEQMGEWLQSGEVDIVTETIFSALTLQKEYGAKMELLRWEKGVDQYHSVFFTHQESGIDNLNDLKGKVIAFEDKGSTSSYFIPVATLINNEFKLNKLRSVQDTVKHDEIGYVFVKDQLIRASEKSISSWVYRKQVDAGVFSNHDWEDPAIVPPSYKRKLKVIHRSIPVPRSIILYSPRLTGPIKEEITSVLLNAHKTANGKSALEAFQETKKFEPLNERSELFTPIEKLHEIVVETIY